MPSLVERLLGRITGRRADARPTLVPPAMIPGAFAAPELCMRAVDAVEESGLYACQLKVDGVRALYIGGRIVTREGTPLDCALHCQPGLMRLERAFGEPMMFDAEYVEDEGFNATIGAMKSGIGQGVCWVFDAVPMREWQTDVYVTPIEKRLEALNALALEADSPFVGVLDHWMLNWHDAQAKAREVWAEGFEGIVRKRAGSLYSRTRSPAWQRIKQTFTVEGPIVDVIQKGGLLRAVMVRTGDRVIKVATGWTADEGRTIHDAWLAVDPESPGRLMAEISYQLSTGVTRSVRGARFHRLRHDLKGSK